MFVGRIKFLVSGTKKEIFLCASCLNIKAERWFVCVRDSALLAVFPTRLPLARGL